MNEADAPSRRLSRSDARLSRESFASAESEFVGELGHSFDLMALDSNTMRGKGGMPLPHFSPHPSPKSRCVNVFAQELHIAPDMTNPYVFPPFNLIGPVLRFLVEFGKPITIIVPELSPLPYWWPVLMARCSGRFCPGVRGDKHVLLASSKSGYINIPCPATL